MIGWGLPAYRRVALLHLSLPIAQLLGGVGVAVYLSYFDPLLGSLQGGIPEHVLRFSAFVSVLVYSSLYYWEIALGGREREFFVHRPRREWTAEEEALGLAYLFSLPRRVLQVGSLVWVTGMGASTLYAIATSELSSDEGVRIFLGGSLIGGGLANFAGYLIAEVAVRRAIADLFPEIDARDLPAGAGVSRKVLVMLVGVGIVPAIVIATDSYTHAMQLADRSEELSTLARLGLGNLFVVVVSGILVAITAWWAARGLVWPLADLRQVAARLGRGDFSARAAVHSNDEVGHLAASLNQMARDLAERERVRDLFGRYVNDQLLDELLDGRRRVETGGEARDVAIVFTDVRGFSAIAERLGPAETMRLMNEYFEAITDVVIAREGTVLEYTGDGILAVFGAPIAHADDAERAVRACLEMQRAIATLNDRFAAAGRPTLQVGMGVHYGSVIVGNIGSSRRMQYGVVGDPVNVAARIESLTKEKEVPILVSGEVAARLPSDIRCEALGSSQVKGRAGDVALHSVLDALR